MPERMTTSACKKACLDFHFRRRNFRFCTAMVAIAAADGGLDGGSGRSLLVVNVG